MLSLIVSRLLLAATPFVVYWAWREIARRTGRPMGSTPWGWLIAAAGVLVALSLIATGLMREDTRQKIYVPAEAGPDGRIRPGGFVETPPAR